MKKEVEVFFDPDCIPCIINQTNRVAKLFTNGNKESHLQILKDVCENVKIINKNFTAPHFSLIIQESVEKNIGISNPYKLLKESNLEIAKKILPQIEKIYNESEDKLGTSIKIAIFGNTIDLGANPNFDLEAELINKNFGKINQAELERFKNEIDKSETILYIGDNYEEALFDIYLLKELEHKNLIFAVRSKPILNDITIDDAKILGINKICKIIESGSKIAGTDLDKCTPEFLELYHNSDLVISKGQGNYETLFDELRPIFFLFKVKCEVIALRSGLNKGEGALLYNKNVKRD